jgi:ribonuclease VapC
VIVDTSAIVAIIRHEPERQAFAEALGAAPSVAMSTATWLESCLVLDRHPNPLVPRRFAEQLETARIALVPVTAEHVEVARAAHRDFGRGSGHLARLNFGDCFSYALAKVAGEPLLFKGDDFVHTDVRPAV